VFDQFNRSQIGTGEGAQAYGHGFYFAENEAVARSYQGANIAGGKPSLTLSNGMTFPYESPQAQALLGMPFRTIAESKERFAALEKEFGDGRFSARLKAIEKLPDDARVEAGAIYKVELQIGAVNRMLDWDKPIKDQPESIKAALKKLGWYQDPDSIGRTVGEEFGTSGAPTKEVADSLLAEGITGIRYLDQGSRAEGQGTSNFVLFDPEQARIVERNGEPVTFDQVRAAAEANAQPDAIRSAEPKASAATDAVLNDAKAARNVDLESAESELEVSLSAAKEMADALGEGDRLGKDLAEYDAAIKRAEEYAKALRAGAACGVA
jgi:hypothetical protein